jgi:hypothetical protein
MECRIDAENSTTTTIFSGDTTFFRRLQELYPGKFHYENPGPDPAFCFNLQLDEER